MKTYTTTQTTTQTARQNRLISGYYFNKGTNQQLLPIIEGIATGTPDNTTSQAEAARFVASLAGMNRNRDRIAKIYENTRIEQRKLATNLLTEETYEFSQQAGTIDERMEMFAKYAFPLADRVAKKALKAAEASFVPNLDGNSETIEDTIGLIVFVTSTGFIAPGIDAQLIKSLGLKRNIARIPVHFMGCAAAMNGLRVACDFVKANPGQKALVVCLELSSVNAVFDDNINDVIIHSIFGDGCAAVVIGAREENSLYGLGKIAIKDNFSYLVEDTEDGIRLGIKDNGITCTLSRELPNYIKAGVNPIIRNFLASHNLTKENVDLWAVHPGGTKIIENVQSSLELKDEQITDSWEILRQYGNILSCAILFVLERMISRLEDREQEQETIPEKLTGLSFSFAPGIGIEGILFEKY
jgi:alpha-pyrone synthase